MQYVTIKVVSSNPVHGEVYSSNVMCVSDLRWFSPGIPVSFPNTTERYDIADILKVEAKTITLTHVILSFLAVTSIVSLYILKCH